MNTKHYFTKLVGKTETIYGPFATAQDARKAAFFSRECNTCTQHQGRLAFMTCGYDDNEISYLVANPSEHGYDKVIVKAKAPLHSTWKKFPAEFRASYFADCYKFTFGEAAE